MASEAPAQLLLDTHIWLWLMNGARLDTPTVQAIERAATDGHVYVSAISVWAVGMLESKGRIRLSRDGSECVRQALTMPDVRLVPLSSEIALASSRLPGLFHGDSADRILAASARLMNLTLVTRDERLLAYGAAHDVSVFVREAAPSSPPPKSPGPLGCKLG